MSVEIEQYSEGFECLNCGAWIVVDRESSVSHKMHDPAPDYTCLHLHGTPLEYFVEIRVTVP